MALPAPHLEAMTTEELSFLTQMERKERRTYRKILVWLLVMSFVFPFITSWYRFSDSGIMQFSIGKFSLSIVILAGISLVSVGMVYQVYHRGLLLDIKLKKKTVSTHKIMKKVAVAGGSFHFYIESPVKLSIEVSESDFGAYREGDEICIEFAENSQHYFGYF